MSKRPLGRSRKTKWRRFVTVTPRLDTRKDKATLSRMLKRAMAKTTADPKDCDDGVICQGCGRELEADNTNGWCSEECWRRRPNK